MIIYNMRKPVDCICDSSVGVVGENLVHTEEFYIKGMTDSTITYTLHLRFADGSVNSVVPDLVRSDEEGTLITWIIKKNDIFVHGCFELQIEGRNSKELVFQTEIVKLYADESLPVENQAYANPNSETLKLRDEIYELNKNISDYELEISEEVLSAKEDTSNKVTSFEPDFSDSTKFPTVRAIINYLQDRYYDFNETYNMDEIDEKLSKITAEFKTDLSQLTPEFANSVDECTDTSKVYVLPDGYIYAYVKAEREDFTYTNLADTTLATDTTLTATSQGWMENVRINSSGSVVTADGYDITNMISVNDAEVIRCKGLDLSGGYGRFYFYKNGSLIFSGTGATILSTYNVSTSDDYVELNVSDLTSYLSTNASSYSDFDSFRIGGALTDTKNDVVVTLDEEISEPVIVTDYAWTNTSHAFIPADYEDRILALENAELTDGVPQYVKDEAERVADLVLEAMTENSLVSAHFSDCHYYYDGIKDESTQAVEHTAYGINEIGKYINLDYIANHGDYDTDVSTDRTKSAVKKINSALNSDKEIQLVGNHDVVEKPFTESQMFAYIGSQNTHCVLDYDNKAGIYGYKDFEHCKIRTIFLNTSDILTSTTSSYAMVSPKQLQWIVDKALDFSDKENAEEWAINIISHIPLHWNDNLKQVLQVFDDYIDGASGNATADGETVSYDFSSRTRAEIICYYHGHTHNYMVKYIGTHNTPCLATPQVCPDRYNEYAESAPTLGGEFDESGNAVYYYKTADTAESTSFVVNVIDRVNRKIRSIHYGAGVDREISY